MTYRRRPPLSAWLAICAILLQALLPVFHHPAVAISGAPGWLAAGWLADAKNFCFTPGNAPADPSDTDKSPKHRIAPCAICQASHLAASFIPPGSVTLPARTYVAVAAIFGEAVALPHRPQTWAQPRAPPPSA